MAEFREPFTGVTVITDGGAAWLRTLGYEEIAPAPEPKAKPEAPAEPEPEDEPAPVKKAAPAEKAAPRKTTTSK